MPRRDGFPTNQEMLADFTAASHEVFVQNYELDMQGNLPLDFQGKSLQHLRFEAVRFPGLQDPAELDEENLKVIPLDMGLVESLSDHLRFKDYPGDIHEHYSSIAENIEQTELTDSLRIRTVVPVQGIDAHYTATFPDGRQRHVNSFKEKPAKQSLAAAKFFVEEVKTSITSGDDGRLTIDKFIGEYLANPEVPAFIRRFSYAITPNLALNGHEPRAFLERFYATMFNRALNVDQRLGRLEHLGAPKIIIESERERYSSYDKAVKNVVRILDQQ